jgi:hypothetical protein
VIEQRGRRLVAGALLAALLSGAALTLVTHLWSKPLDVPFQLARSPGDDEQDATLDLMLIKDVKERGWFNENPHLNAPFAQHWAEWPMGGDLLAYVVKKGLVDGTGDVALTFNLFWLLTFPLTALVAFPVLRRLRCSWGTALVGAVLFSLAPYHFWNGAGHENLAFYVGVPVIVLVCMQILAPDGALPASNELRHRRGWWRLRWLLLGSVLIGVTGLYYLAFFLTLLAFCAVVRGIVDRQLSRLVIVVPFAAVSLATSFVANLPTLLYRWEHAPNILGVPDRPLGISEQYPLRLVELLSPVTGHRFGPFAALADDLLSPSRSAFPVAQLGFAAAIGFVCALVVLVVRVLRRPDRPSWIFEARIGIIVLGALLLGIGGGVSRALELVGLEGVRAWNRIAIVIAFAGIVVFARLLDRMRAHLRGHRLSRFLWAPALAGVLVVGVLDQASPALMPMPQSRESLWRADGALVSRLERKLPKGAMVFQLPVVDFPEQGSVEQMSGYDLIKEGYLHSKTLRWSTGGVRGRDGEWQWPAAQLRTGDLIRGLVAMGFTGLTLDRYGYPKDGTSELHRLRELLGPPIARRGDRLVAWDLQQAPPSLIGSLSPTDRRRLTRELLDAPRLYMNSDAAPVVNRGEPRATCQRASITIINPGDRTVRRDLELTYDQAHSHATRGDVRANRRRIAITTEHVNVVPLHLRHGTTTFTVHIDTPHARCDTIDVAALPRLSAKLRQASLDPAANSPAPL